MRKSRNCIVLVLLVAATLPLWPASSSRAGDEMKGRRWGAEAIVEGDEQNWSTATGEHVAERTAIVDGLLRVAGDPERGDFARGGAILQLGAVPTAKGLRFCAEHLSDPFDEFAWGPRLFHRFFPCRQVLIRAGWASVPFCLARLTAAEATEEDLRNIAFVLREVCGPASACALLGSLETAGEERASRVARAQQYVETWEPPMHIPPPPPPARPPGGNGQAVPSR